MKKYKDKILEFKDSSLTPQELMEMANVTEETSGIEKVVIWIGAAEPSHGNRIKVSNLPNRFDGHDCFTLTIPDFKVIGKVNRSLITTKVMDKIQEFVTLNLQIILQYSNYQISTKTLLDNLQKV